MNGRKRVIALGLILCMVLSLAPAIGVYADSTVYYTKSGSKYHYSRSCRGLSRAKNVYSTSLSSARSKGLTACSICSGGSSGGSTGGGNSNGETTNNETTTRTEKTTLSKPVFEKWAKNTAYWSKVSGATYYKISLSINDRLAQTNTIKISDTTTDTKYDISSKVTQCLKENGKYGKYSDVYASISIVACNDNKELYNNSPELTESTRWHHSCEFGEEVIASLPTCTVSGAKTANCLLCGKTQIEDIPATGHNYTKQTSEDGKIYKKCTNCGDVVYLGIVTKSMYRLYNKNSGEHFYTSDSTEMNNLISAGWASEGTAWMAPIKSKNPVYRVYNPNSGEHHYTMMPIERDNLIKNGWIDEGIGWYSDESQNTPMYRLYNPNATGQYEAGRIIIQRISLRKVGL